jgi:hypothetical protein
MAGMSNALLLNICRKCTRTRCRFSDTLLKAVPCQGSLVQWEFLGHDREPQFDPADPQGARRRRTVHAIERQGARPIVSRPDIGETTADHPGNA